MKKNSGFIFGIVFLFAMIIVGYIYSVNTYNKKIDRGIGEITALSIKTLAEKESRVFKTKLDSKFDSLDNLGDIIEIAEEGKESETVERFFKKFGSLDGTFTSVFVMSAEYGEIYSMGNVKLTGSEEFISEALNGMRFAGNYTISSGEGAKGYFIMSVPVFDGGRVEFVIAAVADTNWLAESIWEDMDAYAARGFIVDDFGNILAKRYDGGDGLKTGDNIVEAYINTEGLEETGKTLRKRLASGGNGTSVYNIGQNGVYMLCQPLGAKGMHLVSIYDKSLMEKEFGFVIDNGVTLEISISICFLMLIFLVILIFENRFRQSSEDKIKLLWNEERYRILAESSQDVILEYDIDEKNFVVSDTYTELFGRSSRFSIDESFMHIHEDDSEKFRDFLDDISGGVERDPIEIRINHETEDRYIWCKITAAILRGKNGTVRRIVGKIEDISDKYDLETEAQTDSLTGLYNRKSIERKIAEYIIRNGDKCGALFIVDIDDFKKINDTYGHMEGDKVIKFVARMLKHSFRESDIIGRLGGDEFIVFMKNIQGGKEAEKKLKLLQRVFSGTGNDEKWITSVFISVGAAVYPKDGRNLDSLYEKADSALYEAKRLGKNRGVLYDVGKTEKNIKSIASCKNGPSEIFSKIISGYSINASERFMLENDNDFLYFSDLNTYELYEIISQKPGLAERRWGNYKGRKCYEVLQERDSPCLFCTNRLLKKDEYLIWSFKNPITNHEYLLKDKLAEWNGKIVRMEIAMDISETGRVRKVLEENLESQRLLNGFLSPLLFDSNKAGAVADMLKALCGFFDAQHTYIQFFGNLPNVYWNRENGFSECIFPSVSADVRILWQESLKNGKQVVISSVDGIKETDPHAYDFLREFDVESIFITPLFVDGKLEGMIGIANVKKHWADLALTRIMASYLAAQIKKDSLREENKKLRYRDMLTGYLSFDGFKIEAERLINEFEGNDYSLWYFDIKNFKYINDAYGFDKGNGLLSYCAEVFDLYLTEDETFCRVSADTFILLKKYKEIGEIGKLFNKLEKALNEYKELAKRYFRVEFSAGIYLIEREELKNITLEEIINRANMAQKRIKGKGGSQMAFFDDTLRLESLRYFNLESEAAHAIQNKEIEVYFQPQAAVGGDNAGGPERAEALARWIRGGNVFSYPDEFIPVLEKSGQIAELDMYMFEESCRFIKMMKEKHKKQVCISVNISKISLMRPNCIEKYKAVKERYSVSNGEIELEFTESAAVENPYKFEKIIDGMKQCGFLCTMDDFGTGDTSLNLLQNLPVDMIKLDKMFFYGRIVNKSRHDIIVKSVLQMAKRLGIRTVVEGVETLEQVEELRKMGCDYIQGYVYSMPLPEEEYEGMLISGMPWND